MRTGRWSPAELLGISYRPALADLPDQKGWRIDPHADYGPLNTFARGKIDLARVRTHWPDMLRVVASIYTGTVRAYDVVTMLQRDGHPTALGEALAAYGRIFKTLHILAYIDADETYPPRHQAHPQPPDRPSRPCPRHLPRQEGRAVPPLRTRPGRPVRRPRPGPQRCRAVDHGVPQRRAGPAKDPGLPGAR
jgi:Tn3 transposase DDE domain